MPRSSNGGAAGCKVCSYFVRVFLEVRLNSRQPFLETVAETLPVNAGSTPKVAGRWLGGEMGL